MKRICLIFVAIVLANTPAYPCLIFVLTKDNHVLVGNHEDWTASLYSVPYASTGREGWKATDHTRR